MSHAAIPAFGLAVYTLTQREIIRFARQRSRWIGALGQPVIFWLLFGAGLRGSFRGPGDASYQEYFFPGVTVMIVMFTAIFSTVSLIEDRREGFLQGVLAAPVSRLAIVMGKLGGGSVLAVAQALLFLVVGSVLSATGLLPAMSSGLTASNLIPVLGWLVLLAFALTALGYCLAWPMESTQGFHAVMSVFLLPMWLLSGSFFPPDDAGWLRLVMWVNPLTYGVAGLRRAMTPAGPITAALPSPLVCLVVTLAMAAVCIGVACVMTTRRGVRNVR